MVRPAFNGGKQHSSSAKKSGNYKTSYPGLPDGQTSTSPIEIRIPEGPIKILAPKNLTQTGVVIDNPNLLITGTKSLISVEGEGCLTLKRGQIQRDASDEPAIILRNQGMLVWEEGKDFVGLKKTDIRDERIDPPEPVPPVRARPRNMAAHSPS